MGVNASREEAQASAGDLQTALLSLQAELAIDYFEARSADAQEKLLNDTVKEYEEAYRITNNRFEGGVAPQSDVDQAKTQLEAARVQASDVHLRRAQYEHAIAVLIGTAAGFVYAARCSACRRGRRRFLWACLRSCWSGARILPLRNVASRRRTTASGLRAPLSSLPCRWARAGGFEGSSLVNLFNPSSYMWAIGPTLSQTLFDAGRRRAASEQAYAGYDETVANYRQTTLTAFQQVEDNLAALRVLEQEAEHQRQATQAAQSAQQIFNNRYVGGIDTYLQVVTAQTTALTNERNDIDIMRRQMDASVLLIKALGGGMGREQSA